MTTYAARGAEKLRRHSLVAAAMQVFLHTNEFNNDPRYSNSATFAIEASPDSFALVAAAVRAARTMWRDGYRYAKAGVIYLDLFRCEDLPTSFSPSHHPERSGRLMSALDAVNSRHGRDTLRPGGTVPRPAWSMRRARLSHCYTTRADEMMEAKA